MFNKDFSKDSDEWKYRELVCKLWTNFAKFDDPTPDGHNPLSLKWNSVGTEQNSSVDYLILQNENIAMKKDIHAERIDFWRKIYEKYNSGDFLNRYYRHKKY